jgi:hypothetical protein
MIRILSFLIDGCWHAWERAPGRAIDHYDMSFGDQSFMYRAVPCRCTKCGKLGVQKDKSGGVG